MAKKLEKIHARAREQFDRIWSASRDERIQALQDRRFYSIAGAQWEGELQEQFENKPRFEVNKTHRSVIRIINEYRNNRITVDFISREGREDDQVADMCDGLYRADELDSCAREAYDNAFEESVGGGMGAWRLCAKYEDEYDEENEYQRIYFEPIFDADQNVFFDLDARRKDKSDAKYAYVLNPITRTAYIEEYGDDPATWPKDESQAEFDWARPDVVYLAEYYEVEETSETLLIYKNDLGEEKKIWAETLEDDEDEQRELEMQNFSLESTRKIKRRRIHKYLMNGNEILEDLGYISGTEIPIVVTYGKRWFVDNIERFMGHVRLAKDAQRLKNMQLSKLGEISALSPREKPILTPEQISGLETFWAEDNIKNYPYALVNPTTDANGNPVSIGPIGYTKPPDIPPALAALLQITEQDMMDLLGEQDKAEKIQSNVSARAVELIHNRLDMQTYIYMSNFSDAMRRCGEIWLSMAKELYVEPNRKMKVVRTSGDIETTEISKPAIMADGKETYLNDISEAKYKVASEIGPTSNSRRESVIRNLMMMMQVTQDPGSMEVLTNLVLMNMEGEGLEEARDYFRQKLLRMGVVRPNDQEAEQLAQEMQNQQPSPQDQLAMAAAQAEQARAQEAQSKIAKNMAEVQKTASDIEKAKAEILEILSSIKREDLKTALEARQAIQPPTGEEQ